MKQSFPSKWLPGNTKDSEPCDLEVINMFIILILVTVSWMYTYVEAYQIAHYMYSILYISYISIKTLVLFKGPQVIPSV